MRCNALRPFEAQPSSTSRPLGSAIRVQSCMPTFRRHSRRVSLTRKQKLSTTAPLYMEGCFCSSLNPSLARNRNQDFALFFAPDRFGQCAVTKPMPLRNSEPGLFGRVARIPIPLSGMPLHSQRNVNRTKPGISGHPPSECHKTCLSTIAPAAAEDLEP